MVIIVGFYRSLHLLEVSKAKALEHARRPVVAPLSNSVVGAELFFEKQLQRTWRDFHAAKITSMHFVTRTICQFTVFVLNSLKFSVSDFEQACQSHKTSSYFQR